MYLPIVLVHKGDSNYLRYSLAQAKQTNPNSEIFLIGDYRNSHYRFVKHKKIVDYLEEGEQFAKIYKHQSSNPFNYELFCFQRWFIIKSFMIKHDIEQCFYMDSDVMLYANVTEEQKKFEQFDFTVSNPGKWWVSGHCTYINSINGLEKFCNFIINLYQNKSLFQSVKIEHEQRDYPGNIMSDMSAFYEYLKRNRNQVGLISEIIDNTIYDHAIASHQGLFEISNGIKNIYWKNNQPFCRKRSGEEIQFNSLHFQGGKAKQYMKNYATNEENMINYFLLLCNKSIAFLRKIEHRAKQLIVHQQSVG